MVTFYLKKVSMKTIFTSNLTYQPFEWALRFEIAYKMPVISLYWLSEQKQISTLTRQTLVLFSQNLVLNWVSLLLVSKTHRKWLKNWKNQTMLEKRIYTYFSV